MRRTNVKEINEKIKWKSLFELRFNKEYKGLTESIRTIALNDYTMFVTFLNAKEYEIDMGHLDVVIHDGMNLGVFERDGSPIDWFKFDGCELKGVTPIILDYAYGHSKVEYTDYIMQISFSSVYKNND